MSRTNRLRKGRNKTFVSHYYMGNNPYRDHKPWYKPPKWYKIMRKRIRKAKEKNSMIKEQYDNIPLFKIEDTYNWS